MMARRKEEVLAEAVIYVGPGQPGRAAVGRIPPRIAESDAACAAILEAAQPPASCGPDIPVAPGRGPMQRITPRRMEATSTGGFVRRHDGFEGRDAARVCDAFDEMERQASNRHAATRRRAEAEGREPPAFVAPFNPGQISIGRTYAALSERVACAGVSCSSFEGRVSGGGGPGDRETAILQDFQQLRAMHRRIGDGLAKEVRRIRPGGLKRRAIRVRVLVDMVCIGGQTLEGVLKAHGWAVDQKSRNALRLSLCAALDRMQGYDLVRPRQRNEGA
ncbi:hypothetical protein [Pseudooceanicola marinus]|uniref:hypothetical protein n=1 Tax=Pseudooceanicola marinus TaxID=396013 RepID=UPI001CD26DC6|nr:hypothetical protein [Pseudooceanicola marinus]MCA1337368.1 hypothetical protein [Pseudooceanicola marinus]